LIQETFDKLKKKKNIKQTEIDEINKLYNQVDKMTEEDLNKTIDTFKIKSPDTANDLSFPFKFNLMFETQIGPTGGLKGFLRPETAQGHFVNFRRLLDFNGGKVPFASASIGLGFRNEISPRSGLLRVREFTMAEIEHYVDPDIKTHKKFNNIKHLKLPLWSADNQEKGLGVINDITIEQAVNTKLIDNETLAYFIARTYIFLTTIGISKNGVRFRQHAHDEMAHYASDCWDAEVETSYGWVEVAGHADRTCYDLTNHTKYSGVELVAAKLLPQPVIKTLTRAVMNKGNIYKSFKDSNKLIVEKLDSLSETEKDQLYEEFKKNGNYVNLNIAGQEIKLTKDFVNFEKYEHKQVEEKFVPGVIEPSFGIGRIVYCVLEHSFGIREKDAKRTFFSFPPIVAPYKVSIIPLIHDEQMLAFVEPISKNLKLIIKEKFWSKMELVTKLMILVIQ
jgi:glycyl-tRNA synthetase